MSAWPSDFELGSEGAVDVHLWDFKDVGDGLREPGLHATMSGQWSLNLGETYPGTWLNIRLESGQELDVVLEPNDVRKPCRLVLEVGT